MQRSTPARRAPLTLVAVVLAISTLLAACGGGGSDDGADKDGKKTTTTAEGGGEKTTTTELSGYTQQFATALEGSGFDEEQTTCILGVADEGFAAGWDAAKLDATYADQCGLSSSEVLAGVYYAALVDKGIGEEEAGCARDLFGALTVEQAQVFQEDQDARNGLLEGCGIDPAAVDAG